MSKSSPRPSKCFNPDMNFGVSKDAPDNFHLQYTKILDKESRKKAICGNDSKPGIFLSDLKRNTPDLKKRFIYEDYCNKEGFSFDSLRFNERIDFIQNDIERIRCRTPFFKMWKRQEETDGKFKLGRGVCTVEANQAFVPRLLNGKIELLRSLLKKKVSGRKTPEPRKRSNEPTRFLTANKKFRRTKYVNEDINSVENVDREILYFENKLALIPESKRWCYRLKQ